MSMVPLSSSREHRSQFLEHVNSIDAHIQLTTVETRPDGCMAFLNTLVISETDRTMSTTVYKKLTHMDQYLQWDRHHNLAAKYSVF